MHTTTKVLAIGLLLACVSGCSDSDSGCDGSKPGCVQMINNTITPWTVAIQPGTGSVSVPAGTGAGPGVTWTTVDSTVGAEITFTISNNFNPGTASCLVASKTWTDPAKPPTVSIFLAYGRNDVACVNWCDTITSVCSP